MYFTLLSSNCDFDTLSLHYDFFFKFYLFIFRERGGEGEREGEKHPCVIASHITPTGDWAHNSGMCPDWESNQRSIGSQAGAQSAEPHQPGHYYFSDECHKCAL